MSELQTLIHRFKDKRIALVGGAQSIFDYDYGSQIDAAEIVIRINRNYPKKKRYQGKKTDLLALSCGINRLQHRFYYRLAPILWMTPNRNSRSGWMFKSKQVYFYDDNDWIRLSTELDGHRPSTGAMTLDFIVCHLQPKELSLYGFDFKKSNTLFTRKQKLGPHNWEIERLHFLKTIDTAQKNGLNWNIYPNTDHQT